MSLELLEVVEQQTLIDAQPELLLDSSDLQLLVALEPALLLVEQEVLTVLLEAGGQGPPGPTGPAGNLGASWFEFRAATPIGGHRAVRLLAGEVIYADNSAIGDANLVLGITRGAAAAGALVEIQPNGLMNEPSWSWTPDLPVFCGAVGMLSQMPPVVGFSLVVGVATAATQICIGARMPLVLT